MSKKKIPVYTGGAYRVWELRIFRHKREQVIVKTVKLQEVIDFYVQEHLGMNAWDVRIDAYLEIDPADLEELD